MDEFDVFMDAESRNVAIKEVIQCAKKADENGSVKQYIFITPQVRFLLVCALVSVRWNGSFGEAANGLGGPVRRGIFTTAVESCAITWSTATRFCCIISTVLLPSQKHSGRVSRCPEPVDDSSLRLPNRGGTVLRLRRRGKALDCFQAGTSSSHSPLLRA